MVQNWVENERILSASQLATCTEYLNEVVGVVEMVETKGRGGGGGGRNSALAAKLHLRESFATGKVYCLAGSRQGLSKYGRGISIKQTSTCETSMRAFVPHGRGYVCVGLPESTATMALGVRWLDEGRC